MGGLFVTSVNTSRYFCLDQLIDNGLGYSEFYNLRLIDGHESDSYREKSIK
jgi:hypothetical protein